MYLLSMSVAFFGTQIQGCDAILARMQEMLLGFQADLGGISDEIKHLQVLYVDKRFADSLIDYLAVGPYHFPQAEIASKGSTETRLQYGNRQKACQRCLVFSRPSSAEDAFANMVTCVWTICGPRGAHSVIGGVSSRSFVYVK